MRMAMYDYSKRILGLSIVIYHVVWTEARALGGRLRRHVLN